jgi:hypothetical protein
VPLVGDSQSPSALLLLLNVFTALSLSRVRGSRPVFRIPPTLAPTVGAHTRDPTSARAHAATMLPIPPPPASGSGSGRTCIETG